MSESARATVLTVRILLSAIGVALIVWALADDPLIGGGAGFGGFQAIVLVAGVVALAGLFLSTSAGASLLTTYISAGIGLVIVELVLSSVFGPRFASAFQLNDEYLYGLQPGIVKAYTHLPENGGTSHQYHVNAAGYRGEPLRPRNEVDFRVAFFGDSFIHAEYSELSGSITEQLENEITTLGIANTKVVNVGVAGYGPDQIALRIGQDLDVLTPDLVIVGVYTGNDFGDLLRNKLFSVSHSGELERLHPEISDDIRFQEELAQKELTIRRLSRQIRDAWQRDPQTDSPEARLDAAMQQQLAEYEELMQNNDRIVKELASDPYSADLSLQPRGELADYKVTLMSKVLTRIHDQVDAQGIPIAFVLIPHPVDVLGGSHGSGVINQTRWPDYDADRIMTYAQEACDAASRSCLSLMSAMREGGEGYYLRGGDDHWNDTGQAAAAAAIAAYLNENNLLPGE